LHFLFPLHTSSGTTRYQDDSGVKVPCTTNAKSVVDVAHN